MHGIIHSLTRSFRSWPFAVLAICLASPPGHASDEDVRVSSVGYIASRAKHASFVGQTSGEFSLKIEDGTEVLTGALRALGEVGVADFSEVTEEGMYYVEVDGFGRSIDFPISAEAMATPFQVAMMGFYGWRSGIHISFEYNGEWFDHNAGHLDDAYLDFVGAEGEIYDGTGGWYDAGDYGKYVVNSACAVGEMLRAWEDNTEVLETIALPFIPETGGEIPDFLDEVKYNIDWMLKMQFADGRVSHKITPYDFVGFVMPAQDGARRYFSKWGSAATAAFVATVAQASRIYRPYDENYADRLLDAAWLSYDYLTENPEEVAPDLSDFANQQYRTADFDDRIWAAAEMWVTTGDDGALADFEDRVLNQPGGEPLFDYNWDWGDLKNLGIHSYLKSERSGKDADLVAALEEAVLDTADDLADTAENGVEAFGRAWEMYYWGSNGLVARACIPLRHAYDLTGDDTYMDTCLDQLANLFGRNQYNRSYVTGVGYDPPLYPHDRRSGASGHAYPGYVVGGGRSATNWVDAEDNYETNEIAINWQGALVYALAQFVPPGENVKDEEDDVLLDSDETTVALSGGGCECRSAGTLERGGPGLSLFDWGIGVLASEGL